MSTYPLNSDMGNGATVADWLGTAATAAKVAAAQMDCIRAGNTIVPVTNMIDAIEKLEQALEEAKAVSRHAAHVIAYGDTSAAAHREDS